MNKAALILLACCLPTGIFAQGTLSGDLQTNINFFMKDTNIGAANNPLYDNYLSGGEGWLTLRYNVKGWTFFARNDVFNHSNLKAPAQAFTGFGFGAYSITKEMDDLTVTGGYIYDQIGSGILFRSYEDRGLLIDNALVGLELKYKLGKKIQLKAFTGQQKYIFEKYQPIIKGFNAEGDYSLGKIHVVPGVGVLSRTLDKGSMDAVAAEINSMPDYSKRFEPRWNMYAFTAYNSLTYKDLQWYVEGSYKTHEAIRDNGVLVDRPGNVEYTTLNYGRKGYAINLSAKRTENYVMRTSPTEVLNNGMLNWQPVVARLRPQRLISRYSPASQDLSEMAYTIDGLISPNDVTNITLTYTHINKLDDTKLYREALAEVYYQGLESWRFQLGAQYMEYQQALYQSKSIPKGSPVIFAFTPYAEITYRFTETKSVRLELQHMGSKQDYGSWMYALLEYNFVPNFSISVSDMYNYDPNYDNQSVKKANHFYSFYGAFTRGAHRLSLAYVKQVEGMNCTGGVCRYEPAFSGIRSTFTTSF